MGTRGYTAIAAVTIAMIPRDFETITVLPRY